MTFRIVTSPGAIQDLRDIWKYIAYNLMALDTADAQIDRIGKKIDSLSAFPMRYPLCRELLWYDTRLRSVLVDRYHVFYIPDEDRGVVGIVRIIHGSRNIQAVFHNYVGPQAFLEV